MPSIHVPGLALAAAASLLGLLAACTDLSEDQCREGNWVGIGLHDGLQGRLPDYLDRHRETCAKVGVTPDAAEWERGRQQGLRTYCTPRSAYEVGREGRALSPVCSSEQLQAMRPAHDWGLRWWEIEEDIEDLERDRASLRTQMTAIVAGDLADPTSYALYQSEIFWIESRINSLELRQIRYSSWPPR